MLWAGWGSVDARFNKNTHTHVVVLTLRVFAFLALIVHRRRFLYRFVAPDVSTGQLLSICRDFLKYCRHSYSCGGGDIRSSSKVKARTGQLTLRCCCIFPIGIGLYRAGRQSGWTWLLCQHRPASCTRRQQQR